MTENSNMQGLFYFFTKNGINITQIANVEFVNSQKTIIKTQTNFKLNGKLLLNLSDSLYCFGLLLRDTRIR